MKLTASNEMVDTATLGTEFRLKSVAGTTVLIGIDLARELRHSLEQLSGDHRLDGWCHLNFGDIEAVSVPFVREFLAPLLTHPGLGPFVATNASYDVSETLDLILRRTGLMIASLPNGSLYGGEIGASSVYSYAVREGRAFKAAELAEALGISIQAANNRLKALLGAGALRRVRTAPAHGGREFAYMAPSIRASSSSSLESAALELTHLATAGVG